MEEISIVGTSAVKKTIFAKTSNNKVILPWANNANLMDHVAGKSEDKLSVCCVCCKIVSFQSDNQSLPESQSAVCGSVCHHVLNQTLAFTQGFVLCKVICHFLQQHGADRKDSHSDVTPSQSVESLNSLDSLNSLVHAASGTVNSTKGSMHKGVKDPHAAPRSSRDLSDASAETVTETLTNSLVKKLSNTVHETRHKKPLAKRSRRTVQSTAKLKTVKGKTRLKPQRGRQHAKAQTSVLEDDTTLANHDSIKESLSVSLPLEENDHSDSDVPEPEENVAADEENNGTISVDSDTKGSAKRKQASEAGMNCRECGKDFSSRRSLKYHLIRHHGKQDSARKKMACRFCGKVCIGQTGLTLHIGNRHAGEKAVECDICGEKFKTSHLLQRHKTLDHNKPHGQCHICGKNFKYAHTLKEHLRAHSGVKGFVCELCGQSFFRQSNLCDHRRRNHAGGSQSNNSDPNASGEMYKRREPRKLKNLQCRECLETMDNIKAWEAHKELHKMNRSIFCPTCGKGFRTHSSLYSHKKQHQEKKFQCDICSKAFTYKCNMERHRETHTTMRPHKCEFCHKTFKTAFVMKRHKVMHIEEKQYKCHICGRGLTCSDNLKKHLRVMHPGSYT